MKTNLKVSEACRDIRHSWVRGNDLVLLSGNKGSVVHFRRVIKCTRCGTERHDEYLMTPNTLEKLGTRYVYAKGYLVPGGVDMQSFRIDMFSNMNFVEESVAEEPSEEPEAAQAS